MTVQRSVDNAGLRFGALEVGRGVAASLVVLHHAGNIVEQPRFFDAVPFGGHLHNFNVGVDFFFVLSGFIIAWVHWNDIGDPRRLGRYALKRFFRIYPPYWAILFPLIALYLLFPQAGIPSQRDPTNILASIVLFPAPDQPVLGVAWTLVHEIFFYLVFAVIIACGKKALWLLAAWAGAIVAASLGGVGSFPLAFFLSPFNLEFILGVGAAALLRHREVPFPGPIAALGVLAFAAAMLFATDVQANPLVGRLAFGIPAVLFVFGCVEIERRRPFILPKRLLFFGAASYAVYLVHPVALSAGVHVFSRLPVRGWPLEAVVLALAVVGIVAGFAYHVVVERPLVRASRRLLESGRTGKAGASMSVKL